MEDHLLRSAGRLLLSDLLVLSGVLIGLVGFGFLVASALMTLSLTVGPRWAALIFGLGFMLLAGGLLAFARGRRSRPAPPGTSKAQRPGSDTGPSAEAGTDESAAVMTAFTVAFVLGRYLNGRKRD